MGYLIGFVVLLIILKLSSRSGNPDRSTSKETGGARENPHRSKAQEMLDALASSMTVGIYCAMGDGNLDNRELATLRNWKAEFVKKAPDAIAADVERAMESEIRRSLKGVSEDRLHSACVEQHSLPVEFRCMTLGLAFEIVAADHKVEPSELACLKKVARLLDVPAETYGSLEEKHLKPIQLVAATSGAANATEQENLLGIDPTWSKDRKLSKLTSEFAKYNARMQTARDDKTRAQCRRMLEIIADLREEIMTGRKPNRNPAPKPTQVAQTPARPAPKPQANALPPPVGSKDEILIGVNLNETPRQRLAFLDAEEARWKGRMSNQLPAAALQRCESALLAIRRLRNVYQAQL